MSSSVNSNYLNGMSEEEIVAHHEYCAKLLTLAEWLDSQNDFYHVNNANSPVFLQRVTKNKNWEDLMAPTNGEWNKYYSVNTTNKDRVIAVLFLREILLDQGSL